MIDGENIIKKLCEKYGVDMETIDDEIWNTAVSLADGTLENFIFDLIESEGKLLLVEFGIKEIGEIGKKESDKK